MATLIWWIRSWFCNHEFTEAMVSVRNDWDEEVSAHRAISSLCKKCSFHRSFKKYQ